MFQSVCGTRVGGSSSAGATRRRSIDTIAESVKVKVPFQGQGLGLPLYHQKMAEAFSSPASSRSGNANTTPQRGQGPVAAVSDEFYLSIRKQPPSFTFPDEVFEFEFGVDGKPSASSSPPSDVEIDVSLKSIKGAVNGEEPTLVLLEAPRVSPSRKTGKVRCKILYEHMARNRGCSMNILLQTKQDRGITPVTTNIVQLVSAKIRVTPSQEWSSVWFKDEGGRDKCMEAKVEVFDSNNHLVKENIPLRLTLCYASSEPITVSNQEILRKLGAESKLMIDSQTGMAKIRFRIEDVSKNHQRQNFLVKVAADRPDIRDIAPGLTPSVSVRSKRNKRQRTGSISGSMGGRLSSGLPDRANSQPSPAGGDRIAATFAESMMMEGADGNRMREAVHGILRWADEVVNGMYYIQWRVVGYASNADGSIDYNRPYHNMQNPNALVDRVLGMYNESTREQLSLLQQAVDQQPHQHPMAALAAATAAAAAAAQPPDSMARGDTPYHAMGQGPPQLAMSPDIGAMPGMPPPDHQSNFFPGMPPRRLEEPYMMGPGSSGLAGGPFHDFSMQQQPPHPLPLQQQQQHQPPLPHQQRRSDQQPPPQHQQHPPPQQQQQQHQQQQHQQQQQQPNYFLPPISQHRQVKAPPLPSAMMRPPGQAKAAPTIDRESEVEYVLAKQYKSVRTGERLGFPAYSIEHEILGFYRESTTKVGVGQFVPVTAQDFGPHEIQQAKKILQGAIAEKSDAVHALKEWGSISSLIDHCLVYDFSKDIGDNSSGSGS